MPHLGKGVDINDVFRLQSKLWGDEGSLDKLQTLLTQRRKSERIQQIIEDVLILKQEFAAPDAPSLGERISSPFTVSALSRIDGLRFQLKAQRKHEKHNYGPYQDYDKAIQQLKGLRQGLRDCPTVDFIDDPSGDEELDIEGALYPEGGTRSRQTRPNASTAQGIRSIREELIKVQNLRTRPKTAEEKLDAMLLKKLRKDRRIKRGTLGAIGLGAAAMGTVLTLGGAVAVAFGFGGLVPAIGIGGAVVIVGVGEIAIAIGPTLAIFGASGALYKRFQIDSAMIKFLRRHYIEQMVDEVFFLNGRERELGFKMRRDLIDAWSHDFKIDICSEEVMWYAGKDNFQRFLDIRHLIGNKKSRKDLAKLMRLERRNLLWAATIADYDDCPV